MSVPILRGIPLPRLAITLAASASALALSACGVVDGIGGSGDSASAKKGDDITVGLLLPDKDTARFENFDRPIIEKEVASLTHGKGKVDYANAEASPATQSRQFRQTPRPSHRTSGRRRPPASPSSPTTGSRRARSTRTSRTTTNSSARSRAAPSSGRSAAGRRPARSS